MLEKNPENRPDAASLLKKDKIQDHVQNILTLVRNYDKGIGELLFKKSIKRKILRKHPIEYLNSLSKCKLKFDDVKFLIGLIKN